MDPVQVQVALFFIIGFPLFPCITFTVFVSSSLSLLISPLLSSFSSPLKSPSSSSPTQSRYLFLILSYYPLLLTATHSHIISFLTLPYPLLFSSYHLFNMNSTSQDLWLVRTLSENNFRISDQKYTMTYLHLPVRTVRTYSCMYIVHVCLYFPLLVLDIPIVLAQNGND